MDNRRTGLGGLVKLWAAGAIGLGLLITPSAAQEREIPLSDDFLAGQCEGGSDAERDRCLAQLAMANKNPDFCKRAPAGKCQELVARTGIEQCRSKSDVAERWICESGVMFRYPAPAACEDSMDHDGCILNVALERKTPNLIAERVSDPEAMQIYLGTYAAAARDLRSLDYLEDPWQHDMIVAYAAFSMGYGQDKELGAEYCARLKGGYAETDDRMSAEQVAGMCRYMASYSDSLVAQERSIESPTKLEQFQEETAERMVALIEGVESGKIDLGDIIPEFKDDYEEGPAYDPEGASKEVTGSWSGTWRRDDTGASGKFGLSISQNADGELSGTFLGQDAVRVSRSGQTVTLTLEPSSECEGATLKFNFSDGRPMNGTYATYGKASSCERTGTYSFP